MCRVRAVGIPGERCVAPRSFEVIRRAARAGSDIVALSCGRVMATQEAKDLACDEMAEPGFSSGHDFCAGLA